MEKQPMPLDERLRLKRRLSQVLSEILSDKYDCKITIHFKPEPDEAEELETNFTDSHK